MKQTLVLFLGTILLYNNTLADTIPYSIQHYTDENGLPQNSVKYIVPDKSGFVWLGTENGLVKFYGTDFITYNQQNCNIVSSRITHIVPSFDNDLRYAITDKKEVIVVKGGQVVASGDSTWFIYKPNEGLPANITEITRYIGISDLHKDHIADTFFLKVNARAVYRITRNSVQYDDGSGGGYLVNSGPVDPWRFFLLNERLYYLTNQAQLLSIYNGAVTNAGLKGDIESNPEYRARPGSLQIFYKICHSDVLLYIGGSLYLLQQGGTNLLETKQLISQFDFNRNNIVSAWYDRVQERVFLGSISKGLFVFTKKQFQTYNYGNNAANEVHYAQAPYGNGMVLSGGNVLGPSTRGFTLPLLRNWREKYSLLIDWQNHIWTRHGNNLYSFNKAGTKMLGQWLLPSAITLLYEGKDNSIWIGTNSHGLFRFDSTATNPGPVVVFPRVQNITYMQQPDDSVLWAASTTGLYRLQLINGDVDTIPQLAGKHIRSINLFAPDSMWLTTYGDGFYLYAGKKLVKFPLDKNKYLATTHCLVEDNKGFCWLSTNKGLFMAAKRDLIEYARGRQSSVFYLYYDKRYGFNTNEFNGGCQPCAVKMQDSFISFPSMNGLVWVNTEKVKIELPDKDMFIEEIKLDNGDLPRSDTLVLPYGFKLLRLSVGTPYFGNYYNVQFEYAVTASTDSPSVWYRPHDNRHITVSSLSSGTYRLIVRQRKGFGANNYTYKYITLAVNSVFYKTWQFNLLAGLLLILAIWAYTKLHLRFIQHKNKMLQQRIGEHTWELQEALQKLKLSELNLRRQNRIQELLIASLTHDVKNPLKYLVAMLKRLKQELTENKLPDETLPQTIKVLYDSSYRMYYLADNLLQYIRLYSRTDGQPVPYEAIPLYEIVEEKVAIFHEIALAQSTVIVNEVQPGFTVRGHYLILSVIIHNLIDNAIKFTSEGKITVSTKTIGKQLFIMIQDTGIGMEPKMVDWYNDYYNNQAQSANETGLPKHSGLGLVIVRELIRLINGKVNIESEYGVGTQVAIILDNS